MESATLGGRPRAVPLRASLSPALPAVAAVTLLAAALRLWSLSGGRENYFYDAAVRSMGLSWHNFLFGALDPGATLSIDKPPLDLWLQVASVKLFGFSATALILPAALAGTLAVPLLYDLVRRLFGRLAGVTSALALAVLPGAVVTARSDTMDSLMMLMGVLAAWLVVLAVQRRRARFLYLAALVMGLAFNVKLFEALLPLPALLLLFCLADTAPLRLRVRRLAVAGAIFLITAVSWAAVVSLAPAASKPFPVGSTNGSVWNVMFVYNGLDRVHHLKPVVVHPPAAHGSRRAGRQAGARGHRPPHAHRRRTTGLLDRYAATKLFAGVPGSRVGLELAAALVLGGLALLVALAMRGRRPALSDAWLRRAGAVALATWLLTGTIVFTRMAGLRARYLEAFSPAVAACLGVAVALLAAWAATLVVRRRPSSGLVAAGIAALVLVPLLAAPAAYSLRLVRHHISDSGEGGALPHYKLGLVERYLTTHRDGTRYEFGAAAPAKAAPLIVRDAQPVLVLTSYRGRQLVTPAELRAKVAAGELRYFVMDHRCTRFTPAGCAPVVRWVASHGTDVTRAAGLPKAGLLYRVTPAQALRAPAASAAGRGRTTTPAARPRSRRGGRRRRASHPARHGRRRRS